MGNISEACFKGLTHWLGGNADKPVTWEKLLKALRESSMVGIADDLEEEIMGESEHVFLLAVSFLPLCSALAGSSPSLRTVCGQMRVHIKYLL